MTTELQKHEQKSPTPQRVRKRTKSLTTFVIVIGLAILAVSLEGFFLPKESGLGREPGWSAYYQPQELQQAAEVHQRFCESFVMSRFEETYSYYIANHQLRFAENLLGLACNVESRWRNLETDSGLQELFESYQLDPHIYSAATRDSRGDFRRGETAQYREALIAQAEDIFADPERRKEFVGQLGKWLRTHSSDHIFRDSSFFIAYEGPFQGYMHESGEQAAFQKRIYQKFGRRSGWYYATQYLVKEDGEWKMAGFELVPADTQEESLNS